MDIESCKDLMKLDYIEATTEIDNVQSQRLLKRMGFSQTSEMKDGLLYFTLREVIGND